MHVSCYVLYSKSAVFHRAFPSPNLMCKIYASKLFKSWTVHILNMATEANYGIPAPVVTSGESVL